MNREDSFLRYLEILAPVFPKALISEKGFERIRRVARLLPIRLSSFFGFECRLGEERANADFLLHLTDEEAGGDVLSGARAERRLPSGILKNTCWKRLAAFAREWTTAGTELGRRADHVWLEFDTARAQAATGVPVPSFFFGLRYQGMTVDDCGPKTSFRDDPVAADFSPRQLNPTAARPSSSSPIRFQNAGSKRAAKAQKTIAEMATDCFWVHDRAFPLVLGRPLPEAQKDLLVRCFDELPKGSYVFQMGTMLSREGSPLRLCVRNIPRSAVPRWLGRTGWQGNRASLSREMASLAPFVDRIDCDVDLPAFSGEIGPKIGLECSLGPSPEIKDRYARFLDFLVARGLCLPQKRDALMQYPGGNHQYEKPDLWPEHLKQASALFRWSQVSVLLRSINHIKLVFQEGRVTEAKAYLSVAHTWMPRPPFKRKSE